MALTPRQRLSRLFRRREQSNASDEPPPDPQAGAPSPVVATGPRWDQKIERMSSSRSLKDKIQRKVSRKPSLSRKAPPASGNSLDNSPTPAAQIAAVTALYQQGTYGDHDFSRDRDSESAADLSSLSLNDDPDTGGYQRQHDGIHSSHSIRREPLHTDAARRDDHAHEVNHADSSIRLVDDTDSGLSSYRDFDSSLDDYSTGRFGDFPTPPRLRQSSTIEGDRDSPVSPISTISTERSLAHKPDHTDLRATAGGYHNNAIHQTTPERSLDRERRSIKRSSLNKPLPRTPGLPSAREDESYRSGPHDSGIHSELDGEREYLIKDAREPVDLSGIVDLSNTEDETLHERWAPAVTHETVTHNVHEIRKEVITREIHNHDIFHRILPIVDVEVLPARHFVPVQGGYAEVDESELPGRTTQDAQAILAAAAEQQMPRSSPPAGPRQFTARKFEGTEGDYREYTAPEGHPKTETTWVHPPRLEDGGQAAGQTHPFHFDSDHPGDDGMRYAMPEGRVIAASPTAMQRMRK